MIDNSPPPDPSGDPPGDAPHPPSRPRRGKLAVPKGILRWSKWRRATLRAQTRAARRARQPPESGAGE